MRVLFLALVLANLGYFAWQTYNQSTTLTDAHAPLPVDAHTPPLVLLKELPSQPPAPMVPQSQREPVLQELPPPDTDPAAAPP